MYRSCRNLCSKTIVSSSCILCRTGTLTDGRNTTKGLDRRKLADDGILLSHVRYTPRVGHGDDCFESFGDHRDRANQRNGEGIQRLGIDPEESSQPSDDGGDSNKTSENLGDEVNLFEDSRLLFLDLRDKRVDRSDFRLITSCHDHSLTSSLSDQRCAETHVLAVA